MSNTFSATVEEGVRCAHLWHDGSTVELRRWEMDLTPKGKAIMQRIARALDDRSIRAIVTEAVAAGY